MRFQVANLVSNGLYREALSLYSCHHAASFLPHKFTFPPLLKASGKLGSVTHGRILHAHLLKTGFFSDVYTTTALTSMYMKLGLEADALKVFDEIPRGNVASLNVAISRFSQKGCFRDALRVFKEARIEGFEANSVTVASVLSGCEDIVGGKQMHCLGIKLGVEMDVYVGTSLLSMYLGCSELILAAKVFERMACKSVVSYNAFLSGLLQNGVPRLVLDVFKLMMASSSEEPNSVTLISVISACANLLYIQFGRQVHGFVKKTEFRFDTMVGTALVDMYSKSGAWRWAYDVFDELNGVRNLITWNSMIAGMMMNGQFEVAAELFEQLGSEGLEPDSATWNSMISGFSQLGKGVEAFQCFQKMQSAAVVPSLKCMTSLLTACSGLSALRSGKEIHCYAIRAEMGSDIFIATSLIDMYMKCGLPLLARIIFDQFNIKLNDPAFWNAVITGYGRNGEYESVFEIFDQMLEKKVEPNSVTFISVLSACSHTGQVEKGLQVFRMMCEEYGMKANREHFGCMVDLLGRHGRLEGAKGLIEKTLEPSPSVFSALLGACRHHLDSKVGEEMAKKLLELEPDDPSPYVILSNIYAALGRWEDVERIRQFIDKKSLKKHPGYSSAVVT